MQYDRDLQALYNQLSDAERTLFDGYVAEELHIALDIANEQAQQNGLGAADPGVVEDILLDDIIRRTDGQDADDNGVGFVPMPDGEYRLVPPTRNPFEATQQEDSAAGLPTAQQTRRQRLLLGGGVLLVGLLAAWWSVGGRTPPSTTPPSPSNRATASASPSTLLGSAGGRAATDPYAPAPERIGQGTSTAPITDAEVRRAKTGYPSSLEIVTGLGEATAPLTRTERSALVYRVVPSDGTLGGTWTPNVAAGTAAWLNGSYVNSVFCLPPQSESTVAELSEGTRVLMRPATGDVREYRIVRVQRVGRQQTEVLSQRKAGMTLIACGVPGDHRVVAEAVYTPPITREPPPLAAQGNELPRYLHVEVADLDARPINDQLVQLNVSVTFRNLSSGEVRWTDLTDQLIVAGQVARPVGQEEWAPIAPGQQQHVVYSYYVPRGTSETEWQVLAPTGEQLAVRFAVPSVKQ